MKIGILSQIYIFSIFILNGITIGLIFDIFRSFRKTFKTSDIITYFEDILFWVISGGITLYLIFYFNNGELRAYIFLGLITGLIIYILFLSKIFMNVSISIISFIKKIILIVLYPFKKLFLITTKFIKKIKKIYDNISKKSSKFLKKIDKILKKVLKLNKKEGKSIEI